MLECLLLLDAEQHNRHSPPPTIRLRHVTHVFIIFCLLKGLDWDIVMFAEDRIVQTFFKYLQFKYSEFFKMKTNLSSEELTLLTTDRKMSDYLIPGNGGLVVVIMGTDGESVSSLSSPQIASISLSSSDISDPFLISSS